MDNDLIATLAPLTAKVAHVHGDHDPRLREVHAAFAELREHLEDKDETAAGQTLARIRTLCDGYQAPQWACSSYRRMLTQLLTLENEVRAGAVVR